MNDETQQPETSTTDDTAQTRLQQASAIANNLLNEIKKVLIGQDAIIEQVLIALIARGHVLIEGVPGLGKTLLVRSLAKCFGGQFSRVQFTPDLMPSDVTGHAMFNMAKQEFEIRRGPVFTNLLLADEINRAPAKTQAALLEVMQEGQITIEGESFRTGEPFMVLATQNPIEQEGTYPLPEAQLDRFLLHVVVDYPSIEAERRILKLARNEAAAVVVDAPAIISQATLQAARYEVLDIYMAESVEEYIVQLINATRRPAAYSPELANLIEYGASPRATIALDRCARAHAWLQGKDFVSPDDVQAVIHDVLRHRLILSFEAEATGTNTQQAIDKLLAVVAVA